eukprot:TRINITY_DN4965_c0_g1_i1.p1 TRINITY_DN4965_c0_g1~~TRINITY_DN4965_c0_g1_i1.p1  ORF type:complete len:778 (+),score=132.85 TRINITY_DN4965_c0_g1_i1:1225-3558(+)
MYSYFIRCSLSSVHPSHQVRTMDSKEAQKKILYTLLNKTGKSLAEIGPVLKAVLQKTGKTLEELQPRLAENGWDLGRTEAAILQPPPTDMRSAWEQAGREMAADPSPYQAYPPPARQASASSASSLPDVPPPPVKLNAFSSGYSAQDALVHPGLRSEHRMPAQAPPSESDTASLASIPENKGEVPHAVQQETGTPRRGSFQEAPVAPPSFMDTGRGSFPAPSFMRMGSLVGTTPKVSAASTPLAQPQFELEQRESHLPLQERVPAVPVTTLKAEIEEKQKENVIKKAAIENQLHKERMEELERELQKMKQSKEERAKQAEDREKENERIQHKVAAATMEWKNAFSNISPHLTQMSDREFTPESVSRSWKKASDATAALEMHKDMLQAERRKREEERKAWSQRLDELNDQRAKDLREQEAAFTKILEQKGQEQTALLHVFHSRLTQVQESYEARLELSNAEAERLVVEHMISPPRIRETPSHAALLPATPVTQLRKGVKGPILSPMTATTTAGILESLDLGTGDVMGYSDSEVERQAEAAARHIAKLAKKKDAEAVDGKKLRKTRKKEKSDTSNPVTPTSEPLPVEVLRKRVQAMSEPVPTPKATPASMPCPYCKYEAPSQSNYCNSCGAFLRGDYALPTSHQVSPIKTQQALSPYAPAPTATHALSPHTTFSPRTVYSGVPTYAQAQAPDHGSGHSSVASYDIHGWSKRYVDKKLWDAYRSEHKLHSSDSYVHLEPTAWNQTAFTHLQGRGRESPSKRRPRISDYSSPHASYFHSAA